jgi:hypothetical protein
MLRERPGQRSKIDKICSEMEYILTTSFGGNGCRLDHPLDEIDTGNFPPPFTSDVSQAGLQRGRIFTKKKSRPRNASKTFAGSHETL